KSFLKRLPPVSPIARQSFIAAGENFLPPDLFHPAHMFLRFPALSPSLLRNMADQLGDWLTIWGDDNFIFFRQSLLGFGPALPQISNGDRLHGLGVACFTPRSRPHSAEGPQIQARRPSVSL